MCSTRKAGGAARVTSAVLAVGALTLLCVGAPARGAAHGGMGRAAAGPAAGAGEVVAAPNFATAVREYRGVIVFSQLDPGLGEWRLAIRRAGAVAPELMPVAPSPRPFAADIGPDPSGRPVLVFQRCSAGLREAKGGCDIDMLPLDGSGGERPVPGANDAVLDDLSPTIWHGQVAWAREFGTRGDAREVVYTRSLSAPVRRPPTRLPGAPRRLCGDFDPRGCARTRNVGIDELELRDRWLAVRVHYGCATCSTATTRSDLRLDDMVRGTSRVVASKRVTLSGVSFVGPSFNGGRLAWYYACLGDPGGCERGKAAPYRYTIATRRYAVGPPGPAFVGGFADAGAQLYEAVRCLDNDFPVVSPGCLIALTPAPAYHRARAPLDRVAGRVP